MMRNVEISVKRKHMLFVMLFLLFISLATVVSAEPGDQMRAATDGCYVRWSIQMENQPASVTCNANDYCSMEVTVLPWTTWKISANFYNVSDGELTAVIPVQRNCSWSSTGNGDFLVDNEGTAYVKGTSGSYVVVSHLVDTYGQAYTARITFNVKNVSVTQSDAMRCVMLNHLADDPYNYLSSYDSVSRYLTNLNLGTNAGKSPLLVKGSQFINGARLDHAIYASLNGSSIVKVEKDNDFEAVAIAKDGITYIAFRGQALYSSYKKGLAFYNSLNCDPETTVVTGYNHGGATASHVSAMTGCRAIVFDGLYLWEAFRYTENPYDVYDIAAFYTGNNVTLYPKLPEQAIRFNPANNMVTLTAGVPSYEGGRNALNEFWGTAANDAITMTTTETSARRVFLGDGNDRLYAEDDTLTTIVNIYNSFFSTIDYVQIPSILTLKNALTSILQTIITDTITSSPNVISGGAGDDFLVGSLKNDHYVYSLGDGNDIIYDLGGNDKIYLLNCEGKSFYIESNPCSKNIVVGGKTVIEFRSNSLGAGKVSIYLGPPEDCGMVGQIIRQGEDPINTVLHYLGIGCPVNVRILDSQGNTVVFLEDGVESSVHEEFGSFAVARIGDEYQKSILLTDPSYQVVIEGIDDGTMDYSSLIYDFESEESFSVQLHGIPVTSGAVYYPVYDDENVIMQVDLDNNGTIDGTVTDDSMITLDQSNADLKLGEKLTLKATVFPADAPFIWASSDENIASVDENGNVTAVGFGKALVGAMLTDGSQKIAYCKIDVKESTITASEFTITSLNSSYPFTGVAVEPQLTISYQDLALVEDQDYDISYSNHYNPGTASVTVSGLGRFSGSITLTYEITATVDTVQEKVNKLVAQCNSQGYTSEYDKALWMHNWLTENADYDFTYTYYDADGVLLQGTGVCQSYSNAYQLLLNGLGIENYVIVSPEMDHSWNLAKIDGEWCHVDCTWDDPAGGGLEHHSYFGLNDDLMSRDHTWDFSLYPAANSLNNYYYTRAGALVADDKSGIMDCFSNAAAQQLDSFEVCYCGNDPGFSIGSVFDEWFNTNNWKYGLKNYTIGVLGYFISINITYTEPWDQPVDLTEPVPCPEFVLNGPGGTYKSSNYGNNGLVLVFGREGCMNTQGLMDRLHNELPLLRESGVEVIVSVEGAESLGDLNAILEVYPDFQYAYHGVSVMFDMLDVIGFPAEYAVYPIIFIIDQDQQIVYYSTDYVYNIDILVSEAFKTATGHALPTPSKDPYTNTQDGDLKELTENEVIQRLYEISLQSNQTVFLYDYSPDNYYSSEQIVKFSQNSDLFDRFGVSLVACFEYATEAQLNNLRTQYPNITFMSANGTNVMWDMLFAVDYPMSEPAYYLGNYLIDNRGHVVHYVNGSVFGMSEITGRFISTFDMSGKLPSQTERIQEEAFIGCAYTSFDLSNTRVKYIDSAAFKNCTNLELIKIPSSVINIAPDAFEGCEKLIIICEYKSCAHEYAEENGIEYILY